MNIMPPFELWFVTIVTIFLGVGFVIWSKNHWLNVLIKIALFVLTVWGVILIYDSHAFF